jgi:hypothetical protein
VPKLAQIPSGLRAKWPRGYRGMRAKVGLLAEQDFCSGHTFWVGVGRLVVIGEDLRDCGHPRRSPGVLARARGKRCLIGRSATDRPAGTGWRP